MPKAPLRVLFLCGKNRARSPTAEHMLAGDVDVEVASAGVSRDADERVTPELVAWADVICVMERAHLAKLNALAGAALRGKRVVNLRVPDDFLYMDPDLVSLLRERIDEALGRRGRAAGPPATPT
jgi:predicted protein tyrosine phosphatase